MAKTSKTAVTVETIAERVGMSVCTVSSVLNGLSKIRRISDKTSRRVREEAELLNYVPNDLARGLRKQRTGVIGVVFADFTNNFAERVLTGMNSVFDAKGYLSFIVAHHWDSEREQRELQSLIQRRVDGIMSIPLPGSVSAYQSIIDRGIPLAFVGDTLIEMPQVSYAAWDSGVAVKRAINHLVDLGKQRIGILYQQWDTQLAKVRRESWEHALAAAGRPSRPEWTAVIGKSDLIVEGLLQDMFSKPVEERPDALYCNNDGLAFAALRALYRMGLRTPEDVAVVSMGDLPRGDEIGAGLSSVSEPCEEIGRLAAESILKLVDGDDTQKSFHLVPGEQLQIRRTTVGKRTL